MKYDKEFIKSLIHYIINHSLYNVLNFTKLNTILLYADILFYGKNNKTLTQSKYLKQKNYCLLNNIIDYLNELQQENKILITRIDDDSPVIFYSTSMYKDIPNTTFNMFNTSKNIYYLDLTNLLDKAINTVIQFTNYDISIFTNAAYNKCYDFIYSSSEYSHNENNKEYLYLLDKLNITCPYNQSIRSSNE